MTCEQHRRSLAADPEERTEELTRHLSRCGQCAYFAQDAARLAVLAGDLPRPSLLAVERTPVEPRGKRRWPLLAVPAALTVLVALWLWLPVPARDTPAPNLALASRDAAPAPAARAAVDLYAAMSDARAVWSGGAVASWSPWPNYSGSDPVEGLDPISDIFSTGLLAEALQGPARGDSDSH